MSLSGSHWALWVLCIILVMSSIWMGTLLVSLRRRFVTLEANLRGLHSSVDITADSSIGVGRKVISLESRLLAAEQKQKQIDSSDPQKATYSEAVRLITMGADTDDLVNRCGLTQAEAELLKTLHVSQKQG